MGGTNVGVATTEELPLTASTTPTEPTITFKDDEADLGITADITDGKVTLPALPTKNPLTRYYWGWIIDGDDSETIYKVGDKVSVDADTKFVARHFPKGDMNFDDVIDGEEVTIASYMAIDDTEGILGMGYEAFWTDDDPAGAIVGDMNDDGVIDGEEVTLACYMAIDDTEGILDMGYDQFWED